jgi:hypothetical protein
MDADYLLIRDLARKLVKAALTPDFYLEETVANRYSNEFYEQNQIVQRLKSHVATQMDNNMGHGFHHAEKVSLDAGALVVIVCRTLDYSSIDTDRLVLLTHLAGLLHDIKRSEKNHAHVSADYAEDHLKTYSLTPVEISDICQAIRNHEAFKESSGQLTEKGLIISNCLYDADKFRWGPDNFTHTVWDMVAQARIPLSVFMSHFPRGLDTVGKVRDTFRSEPGKHYGPQFIDIGISVGNKLYDLIKAEFPAAF